jgi:predicted transcriptional regulator
MGLLSNIFTEQEQMPKKLPEFERKPRSIDEIKKDMKKNESISPLPEPNKTAITSEEPEPEPEPEEPLDFPLLARIGGSMDIKDTIDSVIDISDIEGDIYLEIDPKHDTVSVTLVTENENNENGVDTETLYFILYNKEDPECLKTIIPSVLKETIKLLNDRLKLMEDEDTANEILEDFVSQLELEEPN